MVLDVAPMEGCVGIAYSGNFLVLQKHFQQALFRLDKKLSAIARQR